jgi:hypothetical protein
MPACQRPVKNSERTDHIEESEMFLGLDQFGQFLPLLLGGVDTGWVLGTSVKQELSSVPYRATI